MLVIMNWSKREELHSHLIKFKLRFCEYEGCKLIDITLRIMITKNNLLHFY